MRYSISGVRALIGWHAPWLSPLVIAWIVIVLMGVITPESPKEGYVPLKGNPTTGGVYFIGNSMFGTGLDIEAVNAALPNETATLGYYDGHYTSMWYAVFRNGLVPSEIRPKVVIWGFRPTYAVSPAFRQNKETELDRFYDADDAVFKAVLVGAKDETQGDFHESIGSLSRRRSFQDWLKDVFPILQHRNDLNDGVNRRLAAFVASAFSDTSEIAARFADSNSRLKVSDLIVSFSTYGRVQRADALVIDNGERFIAGQRVDFDQSFVPLTVKILKSARIPQLVVIFKPVSAFDGKMPVEAVSFHHDAVAFLDKEGIPHVDFVSDPLLTRELYAKGDHYTSAGMAYVTTRVVAELRAKGLVE